MNRRALLAGMAVACASPRLANASGHGPLCHHRLSGGAFLSQQRTVVYGDDFVTHQNAARAEGRPVTVVVEDAQEYTRALHSKRDGALPPGSIVLFDLSNRPDRFIEKLDDSIGRVHIHYNVPETIQEALAVHGTEHSRAELLKSLPDMQYVAGEFNSLGGTKIKPDGNLSAAATLKARIKAASTSDLHIVVGHVTRQMIQAPDTYNGVGTRPYDSGFLKMIDGSEYWMSEPPARTRRVWYIGCETWDLIDPLPVLRNVELLVTKMISYQDALNIVRPVVNMRSARDGLSTLQNTLYLAKSFTNPAEKTRLNRELLPVEEHIRPGRPMQYLAPIAQNVMDDAILIDEKAIA